MVERRGVGGNWGRSGEGYGERDGETGRGGRGVEKERLL